MQIINGKWKAIPKQTYIAIFSGCFLAISCVGFLAYWMALDPVTVEADGKKLQWSTVSGTVGQALREKQIALHEGDEVVPGLDAKVTKDLRIQVIRSFPVQVTIAGKTVQVNTISKSVREVLQRAKVSFDSDDKILPALETVVTPGQTIRVISVTEKVETVQVAINPATEYRKDRTMERGVQKVLRQAVPGMLERQVKVVYEDGKPTRRLKMAERILKPAINGIVALGIKPIVSTLVTSRGTYRYIELKNMVATAYYPGPESTGKYAAQARTYTGKKAGFGLVAVDRRVIPLGTMLYIEGYGKAEAADIGAAIKGNRIDLCFETYREAIMYGRRNVKVYILE